MVEYKLKKSSDNPVLHQIMAMLPGWLNNEEVILKDAEKAASVNREILCS